MPPRVDRRTAADEVIVLTAPHTMEDFFHREWPNQARKGVTVPALKLYSHSAD
ncbi:hypothetical protein ACIBCP_39335 [Streptomyces sp. NPDC051287]|uniref:hypothetical protein n=1 Tax=Streptomyces sp. NPDC051287 TaxID=3365648 RepID=UPI003791C9D2